MVRYAVVTAKYERCDKSEKLFRLHIESAGFVCPRIESEESVDHQIVFAEYLAVHALAKFSKFFERS
jgi:hypothetical protein